jgi:hypothetical protein
MSKQVGTVSLAVSEGDEMAVVTESKQRAEEDRGLVAQLVGDAQRQGLPVDGDDGRLGFGYTSRWEGLMIFWTAVGALAATLAALVALAALLKNRTHRHAMTSSRIKGNRQTEISENRVEGPVDITHNRDTIITGNTFGNTRND